MQAISALSGFVKIQFQLEEILFALAGRRLAGNVSPKKTDVTFTDDITAIDWEKLSLIFKRAPLGDRDAAGLHDVFRNSGVRCFAWDGVELVGAGRAITDGLRYAVIFDVVLLPEYQGKGIGKKIMAFLSERSKAANVLLHAVPGKEMFYQKLGFRKMKTAMARFENPDAQHRWGYIE